LPPFPPPFLSCTTSTGTQIHSLTFISLSYSHSGSLLSFSCLSFLSLSLSFFFY
jgi:hypothetical protein